MSKKAAQQAVLPSAQSADSGLPPKLLVPERVNLEAAMARLAPFIFTVDTDTKDTVDLKPVLTAIARDPGVAPNLTQIDRVEAANFVAALNDPSIAALIADVKAQLPLIAEGGGDSWVVAQCVRCRIVALAVEREEARLDEGDAAAVRHAELVERLMDEGLTRSEAEKAALEEEAGDATETGAAGGDEDEEGGVQRAQTFILLRAFPLSAADVSAMSTLKVPIDAVVCVNSAARLGRKDDPVALDPKAKGAKAKPEVKKPDAKKAAGKGGKGAVVDEAAAIPVETLAQNIASELAKATPFDSVHPLRHTYVWTYDVQCTEKPNAPVDEVTGAKVYELQESEAEVSEKAVNEVVRLEQAAYDYREWMRNRSVRKVAAVKTGADAVVRHNADDDDEATVLAEAAAAAEAAAKAAAEKEAKSAPSPGGGKKAAAGAPPRCRREQGWQRCRTRGRGSPGSRSDPRVAPSGAAPALGGGDRSGRRALQASGRRGAAVVHVTRRARALYP
jgi:hypothetical protein